MRIVLDLQGAQASNAQRGIGRYSLALALAIARNRGKHEVFVALNAGFPRTVDRLRAAFAAVLPPEAVSVWDIPESDTAAEPAAAELLREAFLARLRPDIVHVSSLFEGPDDPAVTSVAAFDRRTPVAVTLYDLIPLLRPDVYLKPARTLEWYYRKLGHLRRADLLLAISASSRREAIEQLGSDPGCVANVSADADPLFTPQQLSDAEQQAIRERYGLNRPFVLYTGGIDHRKNIEALVRAFSALPSELKHSHQLAIVCSVDPDSRRRLLDLGRQHGLENGDIVLTGYVPDDDLCVLYGLCRLFVFPSLHEGFGLPALEAMRCGAPVIGSNASSIPEVIGLADALFDPASEPDITCKLAEVLSDERRLGKLAKHALEQAARFNWDDSAREAIAAMERLHAERQAGRAVALPTLPGRPRLAFLSPLPPEQSGIAEYSAQLLPELARFYDIDLITSRADIADPWLRANCRVRSVEGFGAAAHEYDRVLYHFGNSYFHQHMFELLDRVPGVVVLHDFFLGDVQARREHDRPASRAWWQALYDSHGYAALRERAQAQRPEEIIQRYPANFGVLRDAEGVIVHSAHSLQMARRWYGEDAAANWACIPLLRTPHRGGDRAAARRELGWSDGEFVVCSFGMIGATKQSLRLAAAFNASAMSSAPGCRLVFVGANHVGAYGESMTAAAARGPAGRVSITGWTDAATFERYLEAADVAVQLRTLSRGETSAAVLDCMNHGLPTLVNANGSMADLPRDAVYMINDDFTDADLVAALEDLLRDSERRAQISRRGRAYIRKQHAPAACAKQYVQAIERFHDNARLERSGLVAALRAAVPDLAEPRSDPLRAQLAQSIADNLPRPQPARQLLVDISELVQRDARTGIQRVVKQLLAELLDNPPAGMRIEPVYAEWNRVGYRYARKFMLRQVGCDKTLLEDDIIQPCPGDVFLGLDLQSKIVAQQAPFFERWRHRGMHVSFVIYDLLPITLPDCFVPEAAANHAGWLRVVTQYDQALCISRAVADELKDWIAAQAIERPHRGPLDIRWFHLGADIPRDTAGAGLPPEADAVLRALSLRTSFVMVGTLEPRKGHAQTLAAFEALWAQNIDVNLVIVGKHGWKVDVLADALRSHAELGKRLFWLEGISDAYLEAVYAACGCLIAASFDEGFGLPLIEAAQKGLPIIARDIPVFTEVAGEHAFYFKGSSANELAQALAQWLELHAEHRAPSSERMPWLTWKQSAEQLKEALLARP